MSTLIDTRQTVTRLALDRIANTASVGTPTALKEMLESINFGVTPLLEMRATEPTADLVLNIGNISLQDPNLQVNKTIPPINNVAPSFTSGTVTFPSASGGNATPSVGNALQINVSSNNYLKVGINVDANGNIVLLTGNEGASASLATVPPLISNTFPVGYVLLFNNAGTIQNIENSKIYQYIGGGGGTGSSGYAKIFLNM